MHRAALTTALSLSLIIGASALPAVATTSAEGGYDFRAVVDGTEGFEPFTLGCPQINNKKEVAFFGNLDGDEGIFLANRRRIVTLVTSEDVGDGRLNRGVSLNDRRQVAFTYLRNDDTTALAIADRRRVTTVASTASEFESLSSVSLNDRRQVAFLRDLDDGDDTGLFVWDRGRTELLVLGSDHDFTTLFNAVLNDRGQIAFRDFLDGVFLYDDGDIIPVADNSTIISPTLSDLDDRGNALMTGFRDGFNGVFTGSGGPITTLVDTSGPYSFISGAALSDNGKLAFNAFLDDGQSGIFTGPDPVEDKVVTRGDQVLGQALQSAQMCDVNNDGEVVFLGLLADGTEVIVIADPRA